MLSTIQPIIMENGFDDCCLVLTHLSRSKIVLFLLSCYCVCFKRLLWSARYSWVFCVVDKILIFCFHFYRDMKKAKKHTSLQQRGDDGDDEVVDIIAEQRAAAKSASSQQQNKSADDSKQVRIIIQRLNEITACSTLQDENIHKI